MRAWWMCISVSVSRATSRKNVTFLWFDSMRCTSPAPRMPSTSPGKPAPLPRVEVLPGKHIVTIEWVRSKLNEEPYFSVSNAGGVVRTERTYTFLERGEMSIELNVEGGHRYVLVPSKTRNGEPLIEPAVSTRQNLRDLLRR